MSIKKLILKSLIICLTVLGITMPSHAFFGNKFITIKPDNGNVYIPIKNINDGKAHYFKVKSDNGIMVDFFTVKSSDGIIRAAVDACDVCYKSGKGYVQEGNFMVCTNCGRKFATDRINEVKGGCNPAPLLRSIDKDHLVISMKDINSNAWYCKYK